MKALYLLACGMLFNTAASAEPPLRVAPPNSVIPSADAPDSVHVRKQQSRGTHAGLFFRAAVGAGRLMSYNKSLTSEGDRRSFSGTAGSLQLVLGGTLRGKLVMGAAYGRDHVFALASKDTQVDGDEPDLKGYTMVLHSTGYFLDFYFGPHSGTHLQAMLGAAAIHTLRPDGSSLEENPLGLYGQLGVGHELWITDSVLLGGLAAISHARLKARELPSSSVTLRSFLPGLYLSLTVN